MLTRPQTEPQVSETELGLPLSFRPIQYADPTRGTVCLDGIHCEEIWADYQAAAACLSVFVSAAYQSKTGQSL